MKLIREVFTPLEYRQELHKIKATIEKVNSTFILSIETKKNEITSIKYNNYRQVWNYLEKLYNLCINNKGVLIVTEGKARIKLVYGLGRNQILEKFNRIEFIEQEKKRLSNIKRRMVIDTPYKTRNKKIDQRIFNRKTYASSSSRGV
jgi:hypothetical protein